MFVYYAYWMVDELCYWGIKGKTTASSLTSGWRSLESRLRFGNDSWTTERGWGRWPVSTRFGLFSFSVNRCNENWCNNPQRYVVTYWRLRQTVYSRYRQTKSRGRFGLSRQETTDECAYYTSLCNARNGLALTCARWPRAAARSLERIDGVE